jgi:malonyl-CoA/methylmalonyl-CoA synthetase
VLGLALLVHDCEDDRAVVEQTICSGARTVDGQYRAWVEDLAHVTGVALMIHVVAEPLFPRLADPDDGRALRVAGRSLDYRQVAGAAAAVAGRLDGVERVVVWAEPALEACVAVLGGLAAGVAVVPVNPRSGLRELEHVVSDSAPGLVLAWAGVDLPAPLAGLPRYDVSLEQSRERLPDALEREATAIILYTSGTTGLPKGVEIPRRALESNLDALAEVWGWTAADRLTHALPLFHVHGLVLGVLGPLRRGGSVEHVGRFSSAALAEAFGRSATMMFGVPTMYHRLALDAEQDAELAGAFGRARLLVSGSAPLPAVEHLRVERLTGQRIVERYGMTETLMNVSVRASGERRPGYVGLPLPGVEVELVDDDGRPLRVSDDETIGEIRVRGPNLFTRYLNRPEATAEAFREGWFQTGDLATRAGDGYIRIVGRRATDLIKSGGFKIGAGEIEAALLEHPAVSEAAVAGIPDPDLGERVAAWVVCREGTAPSREELAAHVGELLASHKRPRQITFLSELPRNEMGKVMKRALLAPPG